MYLYGLLSSSLLYTSVTTCKRVNHILHHHPAFFFFFFLKSINVHFKLQGLRPAALCSTKQTIYMKLIERTESAIGGTLTIYELLHGPEWPLLCIVGRWVAAWGLWSAAKDFVEPRGACWWGPATPALLLGEPPRAYSCKGTSQYN
ncbi:hypothetical protein F5888DRAFT_1274240 [Russula emetica]|nr:hypothetical protein F5888DRAFT_1274240 [Russula emetica]